MALYLVIVKKKGLIGESVSIYNEYVLRARPNESGENADRFKDINNINNKQRFFSKFPSHILCANGKIKDLTK